MPISMPPICFPRKLEFQISTFQCLYIVMGFFFLFFLDSLNSKHAVSGRHCYSCQPDSPRLLCAVLDPVEDDGIAIRSCSGNPTRLAGNADLWNLVTNLWLDHKCHTHWVQSCLSEREIGFSLLDMQGIVTK